MSLSLVYIFSPHHMLSFASHKPPSPHLLPAFRKTSIPNEEMTGRHLSAGGRSRRDAEGEFMTPVS